MSPSQVLSEVKLAAQARAVSYTKHAWLRMNQRGALPVDVECALKSATSAVWDEDHASWLIEGGRDTDGEPLYLAVALSSNSLEIVTVLGD